MCEALLKKGLSLYYISKYAKKKIDLGGVFLLNEMGMLFALNTNPITVNIFSET